MDSFTKEKRKEIVKHEIKALFKKTYNKPIQSLFYYAKAKKGSQYHLVNRQTGKAICRNFVKPSNIETPIIDIPEDKICKNCIKEYHKGRRENAV